MQMPDANIVAVLGVAATLLSGLLGHVLGVRAERKKQSLLIRAGMLKPIEEWLKGAERIVGILSDSMAAILNNLRLPVGYDMNERRLAYNFMAERTNEIFGILASQELQTRATKRSVQKLNQLITSLDQLIKMQILPRESAIVEKSNNHTLTPEFINECVRVKLQADSQLREAFGAVASIKASLT